MSDSRKAASQEPQPPNGSASNQVHAVNENNANFKSDIEKANPISQLHFWYVLKTLMTALDLQGQEKGLEEKDLVTFPYFRRADVMEKNFLNDMQAQKRRNPNKKPNLTSAIVNTTKLTIGKCVIIAILFSFIRIFTGWVVKKMIDMLDVSKGDALMWAGALAPCLILGFYLEHHYNHIGTYFPLHIRGALVSMIYNKVSKLSLDSIIRISPGQIINLASNDVNVFDETGLYFPKLVMSPLVLVACSSLLWIYFGPICLIGIGYIVLWYPLEAFFIARSEKHSDEKNKVADDRVRLTRESIEGIRLLKMYSWELRFKSRIFETRGQEVRHLKKGLLEQCNWRAISFSSLAVSTFLIYMPYTLTGGELTAGKVFSSFYIMAFMRLYCAFFVNLGMVFLIQARIVLKRIEKIMQEPEMGDVTFEEPKNPINAIEFENFNAFWTKKEAQDGSVKLNMTYPIRPEPVIRPTLKDISLTVKNNSLNALVGPVGSGKTSFLTAFTGEIPETNGSFRYKGKIAYVEQEPTIFAGTFRDSICFGKPFIPEFYESVVKACNLTTDLKLFPKGDMSEIGEKGNNLSGGQKARLALARAVYADTDIYLLDDPLSAVDPKVAKSIYDNCIRGLLKNKTVILVTHQVDFAKSCENIIVMKDGHVLGSGSFDQLKEQNIDTNKIFANINTSSEEADEPVKKEKDIKTKDSNESAKDNQPKTERKTSGLKVSGETQVKRKPNNYAGQLSMRTYKELLKGMGSWLFLLILLAAYVSTEMANIAYGRMLGALLVGTFPQWKSLAILGGLVGFIIFIYFVKYIMLNIGLLRTSDHHHKRMLDRVIQAPVLFFDSNPIGLILNRFANDIGSLDRFLPLVSMDVLDNVFYIGSVIITVGIIQPILLAPLAGAVVAVVIALKVCYEGVKQTKKFDVAAKGPLFGLFSASLSGIVIVRTFNQLDNFSYKFRQQLHTSLKGAIGFAQAARFVGFYSDMAYNVAEIGCIFILVALHEVGTDPCFTGFAVALILSISGILQYTLRQGCLSNTLIVAAARVQGYWELPNEAPITQEKDKELKEKGWPQNGNIAFNKVFMKYTPDGPHVIKDLTLHATEGQKVGCVGRTGAGKTSITMLLYRLQEIDRDAHKEGHIKVDNVDTQTMGLHLLRGNISMIPQTPFILTGTVRYNVDPLGEVSDEEIWKVLEDVRLKEHVENLPQQLDTEMTAMTSVFSVGQKQLVCLARSILRPSSIMIMDEATANMDHETDNFVMNKIMEKFKNATIFTIAHRLSTIANYDRVLALDKGMVKEFDEPYKLLVKEIGDDRITNDDGLFASMVRNTGPDTSKYIFEITKKAYYDRLAKVAQQ